MPAYRRIAAEITAQITAGELPAGAKILSTRQIMARYGVAMATATKVIVSLREAGLVRATPGRGTVVTYGGAATRDAPDRDRIVRVAVTIADAEGLAGLSMRRLAGEVGIPTMSIYRHVEDKEELVLLMMDRVMGLTPPPASLSPAKDGWRACLEALARLQWRMYRRHTWLAQAVSFTRPLLAPNAMAHTEWAMRALEGHGLDPAVQFRAAAMVANYVRGTAINLEEEAQAEQETGVTDTQWMQARMDRLDAVLATGRLPMIARFIATEDADFTLDLLLEFGLQRILDGFEKMLSGPPEAPTGR